MHWATRYLNLIYEPAARGPERVDCWGLIYLVYQNEFGITLPEYPGISVRHPLECSRVIRQGLAQEWRPLETPREGSLVAMGYRKGERVHHLGLYLRADRARILHCFEAVGRVVADRLDQIGGRGVQVLNFYEYGLYHRKPQSV